MPMRSKKRIMSCGAAINFNTMEEIDLEEKSPVKRPMPLTLICVLTFIYTGGSVLISLLAPLLSDELVAMMDMPQFANEKNPDVIRVLRAGWGYYLIIALLNSIALTGAIMMWNLIKNGFHLYTIANIILLYVPVMWFDFPLNMAEIFFTGVFVLFYAMHLRFMK
jgi:hypothetical protein